MSNNNNIQPLYIVSKVLREEKGLRVGQKQRKPADVILEHSFIANCESLSQSFRLQDNKLSSHRNKVIL